MSQSDKRVAALQGKGDHFVVDEVYVYATAQMCAE